MSESLPIGVKVLGATLIVAGVLIVSSFGAILLTTRGPAPERLEPLPFFDDAAFPDFEGVSQSNRPVDASMLDGQVTVVDFFFTHCPLVCPLMTSRWIVHGEPPWGLELALDVKHR